MSVDRQYSLCESIDDEQTSTSGEFERLFPRTRFDTTPSEQLDSIVSELSEFKRELGAGNKDKALIEALDVMQSIATYLYNNFPINDIYQGITQMQQKNRDRGYYTRR
jgi:hypothetical protein